VGEDRGELTRDAGGWKISVDEYDLLASPALRKRQAEELAGSRHAGR